MTTKFVFAIFLLAVAASAEGADSPSEENRHSVGFLMGSGTGTGSTSAHGLFLYGARADFGVYEERSGMLTLGGIMEFQKDTSTVGLFSASEKYSFFGGEILDRRAFGTGLYFGGRAGLAHLEVSLTSPTVRAESDDNTLAIGPVAGYEFDIGDRLSLSVDLSWISIQSGEFPVNSTNIPYSSQNVFLYQAGLNFRF